MRKSRGNATNGFWLDARPHVNVTAAADYAAKHNLQALLVGRDGDVLFERYGFGFDAQTAHPLYSGTKSFWGVAAVAAQVDGLLALDEPVSATFADWRHGAKSRVTLSHLLQLTSGIGFGGLGNAVPTFSAALDVVLKDEPGDRFTYSGIPLQVFGAVLAEKLRGRGQSPQAYLFERILAPIGMHVAKWRSLNDGTQPLPTGAFAAAAEWWKFGRLVLERGAWNGHPVVPGDALARSFLGSAVNPRYGLTWWLSPLPAVPDIVYASGAGGQALYVIPSEKLVVVKFGQSASYRHESFLKRLLMPQR
jgi:CubicO group peptidase (beta-lactamase class C family)